VITPRGFTSMTTTEVEYDFSGFIPTNKQKNKKNNSRRSPRVCPRQVGKVPQTHSNEGENETFERPENSPDWDNHPWLHRYHAGVASHKRRHQNETGKQGVSDSKVVSLSKRPRSDVKNWQRKELAWGSHNKR